MTKTHIWNLRHPNFTNRFQVEFVGTTFALIRAAAFRQVGGYDENYYFYNEDLDWAERAKRCGCHFMFLPEAGVIHFKSKGRVQNQSRITRELYWSNIYYFKKFYPVMSKLIYRLLKIDLWRIIHKLNSQSKRTADHSVRKDLMEKISDYVEAKKGVNAEYRSKRLPQIPRWE